MNWYRHPELADNFEKYWLVKFHRDIENLKHCIEFNKCIQEQLSRGETNLLADPQTVFLRKY